MKKIIIPISALFVASFAQAQLSTSENYVYSKTYLDYDINNQATKASETVQYFDGLGRSKQSVNIKASPLGRDVVTSIQYDGFGRQVLDFLPVPQGGTLNGAIVTNALANATQPDIYGNEKIYAEKLFESAPIERILEQKNVGTDWNAKPVKFSYKTNTIADRVRKFTTVTIWENGATKSELGENWLYNNAQLYKNSTKDEDGNETVEFKNKQGQTILLRKVIGDDEYADTYYVYNEYDQLAYVIPPLASIRGDIVSNTIKHDELCYIYRYDGKNRLVEKKQPGKGLEQMIYNKNGQVVYYRDINLKNGINGFVADEAWTFTKYDKFGRSVYTGICRDGTPRQNIQQAVNGQTVDYETRGGGLTMNGMGIEYSNSTYPVSIEKITSVNYYDKYPVDAPAIPSQILNQPLLTHDAQNSSISTMSLPTASYVKNVEDDNWTKNYSYYDTKGRVIGSHSINYLGGYTKTESKLNFAGIAMQSVTRHKRLNTDSEKVITEIFTYDHQNRLLTHKHQIDSNAEEILVQNKYNELSQLETKKVGGTNPAAPLQTIDYAYNIRGWMTQINNPTDLGTDLFGYKINYNTVEGIETPNLDFPDLKVKPRYNGNIAEVSWKTLTQENEPLKRYGYSYDVMNRLSAGFYQKEGNESAKEYFEKLDYDLNGNILRLRRSEGTITGVTYATMVDNLKYDYSGNRLTKVTDEQLNPSGYPLGGNDISYDNNGNMLNQLDKNITSIQYNYLNLPKQIAQNSKVTNITYRADGVKVKKLFGDIETDYLDGFQYKSTFSQESWNGIGTYIPDPNEIPIIKLRIIPTSEGYYDALLGQYIYNFTDHLGNVRLSYSDTNKDGIIQPRDYSILQCAPKKGCTTIWNPGEIVEINNYYPFGLLHNYTATTNNAYQYKYNSKELQESGMYDYGARMYMPDIGRWGVVDPLSELQFKYSPYSYVYGNPIRFNDPTGMIGEDPDPKKIYGPKGGHPIEEVVMTYTKPSPLSFMGINNMNAFHASEDRFAAGIRGSKAALATEKFEKNLGYAMITFGMGGSNLLASAGWATLDAVADYQDPEDQEAIQKVQLAVMLIQLKHGNVKGLKNLASEAEEVAKKLPALDGTGKVHGDLPKVKDLVNYSKEDLKILLKELKQGVQKRVEVTSILGRDRPHGQRQGAEQDLIKSIEKHLGK